MCCFFLALRLNRIFYRLKWLSSIPSQWIAHKWKLNLLSLASYGDPFSVNKEWKNYDAPNGRLRSCTLINSVLGQPMQRMTKLSMDRGCVIRLRNVAEHTSCWHDFLALLEKITAVYHCIVAHKVHCWGKLQKALTESLFLIWALFFFHCLVYFMRVTIVSMNLLNVATNNVSDATCTKFTTAKRILILAVYLGPNTEMIDAGHIGSEKWYKNAIMQCKQIYSQSYIDTLSRASLGDY